MVNRSNGQKNLFGDAVLANLINFKTPLAEVFLSPEWSSVQADHRSNIRAEIFKKSRNPNHLDLDKLPESKDFFVSISHCRSLGGYAQSLQHSIGFDVEQKKRLSLELIKRIATREEIELFSDGSSELIWSIKEAAFKCLKGEIDLMAEIVVEEVHEVESQIFEGFLSLKNKKLKFLSSSVGSDSVFAVVKSLSI